jgi:uncharacterized protein YprB with RNaseH-like and TPR domain
MLRHSFCHIKGISPRIEADLWDAGFLDWEDVTRARPGWLTQSRHALLREGIAKSRRELKSGNARYFQELLPSHEHWRLFSEFRYRTAFLDIETTGLQPDWAVITTIALYDGKNVKTFVNGKSLDSFCVEIDKYDQIVTYNGKCFDVPFIRRRIKAPMDHAHLDLRYILGRLGYRGGLKECERTLGVKRKGVEEVDGFMAVLLWKEYERGNDKALETLLAYNIADVVNLETLMTKAYNMYLEDTPFKTTLRLEPPISPTIPYRPDRGIIRKLRPLMPTYY